tara:strand:+ start:1072 stop:3357 length:2286 start_codon:yes stop_codon:yes gene_type:complete
MATLAGNTIASTYPLLLKIDSSGIDGTLRAVEDGDGTDSALSIATDSVLVKGDGVKLYFYDADGGEHISADASGNLTIGAGVDLNLTATTDINIPVNVGLRFGDGGENIETDNTNLTITSGNDIILDAGSTGSVYASGAAGTGNTAFGDDSGIALTGNYNTLYGSRAGSALAGGGNNVAMGRNALATHVDGSYNIAIGVGAMGDTDAGTTVDGSLGNVLIGEGTGGGAWANSAVNYTVGVGYQALNGAMTSDATGSVGVGYRAGKSITDGVGNTAVGYNALTTNAEGHYSTAIGYQALEDANENANAQNVAVGYQAALNLSTGAFNTAIGTQAIGNGTTTGDWNVAIGQGAGYALTSGEANIAIGGNAGVAMTTTGATVLIGKSAGEAINSADADGTVAIGKDALKALTDGQNNIAIGHVAADAMTVSNRNVILGAEAFTTAGTATGQDDNIGIGYRALNSANVQDFNRNVAIGSYSMFSSGTNQQTGTVAIGYSALGDLTSGVRNTGVGYTSIYANTTGADNTALGYGSLAGLNHADGDHNTAVGVNGGSNLVTGYQNTFIGSNNQPSASGSINQTTLGYAVTAVANNSVTLGNASVTAVYAGSDSGATVHAGSVISNSNYALEGYSTGRNVLRVIKYKFEDATDANKVKITATSLFNGDAVSVVDNISTSAITNYNFQASFGELRVGYANFTGNVVGIISCETLRNTTGTDMMVQVNNSSANSRIEVYFRNRTSGAELNMEDLVDSGYLEVSLAYITSS